jgi:Mn-dependent DtxR family transcriptional regulator
VPRILTDLEERVLEYLAKLKGPTTTKALGKRFILSDSRASTILKLLHQKGYLDVTQQGSTKLYKFKD